MDSVQGCRVLCEALVKQGVKYMFGVVGIPVIEIALAAQSLGIKYFGMRNEQAVRNLIGMQRRSQPENVVSLLRF